MKYEFKVTATSMCFDSTGKQVLLDTNYDVTAILFGGDTLEFETGFDSHGNENTLEDVRINLYEQLMSELSDIMTYRGYNDTDYSYNSQNATFSIYADFAEQVHLGGLLTNFKFKEV